MITIVFGFGRSEISFVPQRQIALLFQLFIASLCTRPSLCDGLTRVKLRGEKKMKESVRLFHTKPQSAIKRSSFDVNFVVYSDDKLPRRAVSHRPARERDEVVLCVRGSMSTR